MTGYEGETRRLGGPRKVKWEYLTCRCYVADINPNPFKIVHAWVIDIDGTEYPIDEGLNYLGQDGWELVTVQQVSQQPDDFGGYLSYRHIFKRPLD